MRGKCFEFGEKFNITICTEAADYSRDRQNYKRKMVNMKNKSTLTVSKFKCNSPNVLRIVFFRMLEQCSKTSSKIPRGILVWFSNVFLLPKNNVARQIESNCHLVDNCRIFFFVFSFTFFLIQQIRGSYSRMSCFRCCFFLVLSFYCTIQILFVCLFIHSFCLCR